MKACNWCGEKHDVPFGKLCHKCRKVADKGKRRLKWDDAMYHRWPGSFEMGKRR